MCLCPLLALKYCVFCTLDVKLVLTLEQDTCHCTTDFQNQSYSLVIYLTLSFCFQSLAVNYRMVNVEIKKTH